MKLAERTAALTFLPVGRKRRSTGQNFVTTFKVALHPKIRKKAQFNRNLLEAFRISTDRDIFLWIRFTCNIRRFSVTQTLSHKSQ